MMLLPPKRPRVPRRTLGPDRPEPDTVRAFLIAPLVPAALLGLCAMGVGLAFGCLVLAYAAFAGYAAAILLGLPLYLAVPEKVRRSTGATALAGGAVAAVVPTAAGFLGGGAGALGWAAGAFALGGLGGVIFALIRNAAQEHRPLGPVRSERGDDAQASELERFPVDQVIPPDR